MVPRDSPLTVRNLMTLQIKTVTRQQNTAHGGVQIQISLDHKVI